MVRAQSTDMAETQQSLVWRPALGTDIAAMVKLTQVGFECEANEIFRTDPTVLAHNITRSVVDQFYNPGTAFLYLAQAQDQVRAYVWAERGQRTVWSPDEMVAIRILHVDLAQSARERVRAVHEALELVETWASVIQVPVICSTTMRQDQEAFLRIHERRGYQRRGSICYRRILT